MSLNPLSWRSIRAINRTAGPFVAVSAESDGTLLAVDPDGRCFEIARRGRAVVGVPMPVDSPTTTSRFLSGDEPSGISDEWRAELERRLSELRRV